MLQKKIKIFTIMFSLLVALCSPAFAISINNNTIKDTFNFSIEAKEYKKIVVLDPAVVENLYLFNAMKNVVAIAKPSSPIAPNNKVINALPNVGSLFNPSIEKIISYSPDLVILNYANQKIGQELQKHNIPVIYFDITTIDSLFNSAKILAKLVNKEKDANKVITSYQNKLNNIKKNPLNNLKGGLFYSLNPLMAFGNDTFAGQILSFYGLDNIAKNSVGHQSIIAIEYVIKENPDFIIGFSNLTAMESTYPALAQTVAGKNKQIIFIAPGQILRGSLNAIDHINNLYAQLKVISDKKKNM